MSRSHSGETAEICLKGHFHIARDGSWHHEGRPIHRQALVKLFSTILKREGDRYFLVTPGEKVPVSVACCPFIAVSTWRDDNQQIFIRTNVDDVVAVNANNTQLHVLDESGQSIPKAEVRDGLFALLSRNAYYQWVEWAKIKDNNGVLEFVVHSGNNEISLGHIHENSF
ncbi:MAG: DUF1285 domain-containing protein [Gammaproteobacteria bacterium]|nr:MAG: DUF1285 domain-containing protein [Gammaproteobacteria bacterium]